MATPSSEQAVRELRIQTICQMTLVGVLVGAALYWLRSVLLPFVLAVFFVCAISPVLDLIQKRLRAPRIVAVAVAFLIGIAMLVLLWLFVWASVAALLRDGDQYRRNFDALYRRVSDALRVDKLEGARDGDAAASPEVGTAKPQGGNAAPEDDSLSAFLGERLRLVLGDLTAALMDVLSKGLMVLVFMFFLLLGGTSQAIPRSGTWREIESRVRRYIVTKTLISLVTGAAFGLALWLFGIPLAVVFGLLAFLLNFIPNIGPIVAGLLPLPLIVLAPELSVAAKVAVIALTGGIQFASGNVFETKIMGSSFELHPVAVLLSLMVWGMIWGIVGMFVATPVTAAAKILLERFDHTRPIALLLAGRLDAFGRQSAAR
jgi:AI-2 transport protein TqsA